jgi:hypothetical protein
MCVLRIITRPASAHLFGRHPLPIRFTSGARVLSRLFDVRALAVRTGVPGVGSDGRLLCAHPVHRHTTLV